MIFPHDQVGFSDGEWYGIPRIKRMVIRDFFLFKGDQGSVQEWNELETDFSVRTTVKAYKLKDRPLVKFQNILFA